jgi:hypothetical protein
MYCKKDDGPWCGARECARSCNYCGERKTTNVGLRRAPKPPPSPRLQNIPPPRTKIGDMVRQIFAPDPVPLGVDFAELERQIAERHPEIIVDISNPKDPE